MTLTLKIILIKFLLCWFIDVLEIDMEKIYDIDGSRRLGEIK